MSSVKFKKHHEHQESDELWLISYADLMTLLLGLFVILFSYSDINEQKFSEMQKEIAKSMGEKSTEVPTQTSIDNERRLKAFQYLVSMLNLGDMDQAIEKIEKLASTSRDTRTSSESLRQLAAKQGLVEGAFGSAAINDKENVIAIALPSNILFTPGGETLLPAAKTELRKLAKKLVLYPNFESIEVTGHTDATPPGSNAKFSNNWSLSAARAGSVAQELSLNGVPPTKMTTRGLASTSPLFPEIGSGNRIIVENRAKNRRVQIEIRLRKLGGADAKL